MTATVKVMPSGHEFLVEGRESILEAGLKGGLNLDYGCSSGNCGACKARVVSGEVRKIQDHDFVFNERERRLGFILACSWTAVTDVELEASEAHSAADLPSQTIYAKAAKVEPLGDGISLLHLRTPRTRTLRFLAGQSVRLTDEEGHSGNYPVASCPCDGRNLEFLIPWREGDRFAEGVRDGRTKNQAVEVNGPFGDFVLKEDSSRPAVFIAIGPGFAAIKSLLEHAIASEATASLHLYRVDHPKSRGRLDNLCRSWADCLDNFSCSLIAPELPANAALSRIRKDLPELDAYDLYLAGPGEQVDAFLRAAQCLGPPSERIRWTRLD